MPIIKSNSGYQIKLDSGKLLSKIYPTLADAYKRLIQLKNFLRKGSK